MLQNKYKHFALSNITMRIINFLSKTASVLNRNNHPFSKLTKEDKKEYFLFYPAVVGGLIGAKMGWDGGFEMTKHDHCFINIAMTAGGMGYGSIIGAALGAIWPVSVPVMIARQYVEKKGDKK